MKVGKSVGHKVGSVDKMISDSICDLVRNSACILVRAIVRRMIWGSLIRSVSVPTASIKQTNRDKL